MGARVSGHIAGLGVALAAHRARVRPQVGVGARVPLQVGCSGHRRSARIAVSFVHDMV
jgi:hypothetical protein